MKVLGVLLVIVGMVALLYGGFTYTKHEKVIDVGPIEASVDKKERFPMPPVAGAIAVLAGVVLLVSSRRRTA